MVFYRCWFCYLWLPTQTRIGTNSELFVWTDEAHFFILNGCGNTQRIMVRYQLSIAQQVEITWAERYSLISLRNSLYLFVEICSAFVFFEKICLQNYVLKFDRPHFRLMKQKIEFTIHHFSLLTKTLKIMHPPPPHIYDVWVDAQKNKG